MMNIFAIRDRVKEENCDAAGFSSDRTNWVIIHGIDWSLFCHLVQELLYDTWIVPLSI